MVSVLVTGGSGFVGTWVARELLLQGHQPVLFDLQPASERWNAVLGHRASDIVFVEGSVTNSSLIGRTLDDHNAEAVIHLGALLTPACQQNPLLGCEVNVLGTVAMFEQVRHRVERIPRISWASSLGVFGAVPESVLPTEITDETHAPNFYGAFKRAAELIVVQYWKHFGLSSLGIRPHVVYGPERTDGLTAGPSLAAKAVALGEAGHINYSGTCGYDYVEDVAKALVRAAFDGPVGAHIVDLPSEEAQPADLVALMQQVQPAAQVDFGGPAIPQNCPETTTPISLVFEDWTPTSLKEGLRQTIRFYGRASESPAD